MTDSLLSPNRLLEVRAALEQLVTARHAVEDLMDGEPRSQPPSVRFVQLRRIASAIEALEIQLTALYR